MLGNKEKYGLSRVIINPYHLEVICTVIHYLITEVENDLKKKINITLEFASVRQLSKLFNSQIQFRDSTWINIILIL